MLFNAIRENKILAKISGFTVMLCLGSMRMDSVISELCFKGQFTKEL